MTGTILSGSVSLGDNVEIPALKVSLSFSFPLVFLIERDTQQRKRVFSSNLKLLNYFQFLFLYSVITQLITVRGIIDRFLNKAVSKVTGSVI